MTRIRSRNYSEPTTVSDIDSDDSEVGTSKLKGDAPRARRPTPPRTDQPEPARCATRRDDNSRERYCTWPATPTVLRMTPTRPSGGVLGYSSPILEPLAILQSYLVGDHVWAGTAAPRRLRPSPAGRGEDCWNGPPISPPPGRATAPILRRDHSHAHEPCSATGTEHGLSGGTESVHGKREPRFDHLIIHHSNNQSRLRHVTICQATAEIECGC